MEPALLDCHPLLWPDGLSLLNHSGINAWLGRGLGPRADGLHP
jgi:hypothetical protein